MDFPLQIPGGISLIVCKIWTEPVGVLNVSGYCLKLFENNNGLTWLGGYSANIHMLYETEVGAAKMQAETVWMPAASADLPAGGNNNFRNFFKEKINFRAF